MSKVGGRTTLTADVCPDAVALAKEFHPAAAAAGDIYEMPWNSLPKPEDNVLNTGTAGTALMPALLAGRTAEEGDAQGLDPNGAHGRAG